MDIPVKVSRADTRYSAKVIDLKDQSVFDPKTQDEAQMLGEIITHYIETIEDADTRGGEGDLDGGDL